MATHTDFQPQSIGKSGLTDASKENKGFSFTLNQDLSQKILEAIFRHSDAVHLNNGVDFRDKKGDLFQYLMLYLPELKRFVDAQPDITTILEQCCEVIRQVCTLNWMESQKLLEGLLLNSTFVDRFPFLIYGLTQAIDYILTQQKFEYQARLLQQYHSSAEVLFSFLLVLDKSVKTLGDKQLTEKIRALFKATLTYSLTKPMWRLSRLLVKDLHVEVTQDIQKGIMDIPEFNEPAEDIHAFVETLDAIKIFRYIPGLISVEELGLHLQRYRIKRPAFFDYMEEIQDRIMLAHLWGLNDKANKISDLEGFSFEVSGLMPRLARDKLKLYLRQFSKDLHETAALKEKIQACTSLTRDQISSILSEAEKDIINMRSPKEMKEAAEFDEMTFLLLKTKDSTTGGQHIISCGVFGKYCLIMNRGGEIRGRPYGSGVSVYLSESPRAGHAATLNFMSAENINDIIVYLSTHYQFVRAVPMKDQLNSNCGTIAAKGIYFFAVYFRTLKVLQAQSLLLDDKQKEEMAEKLACLCMKHFSHYCRKLSLILYKQKNNVIPRDNALLERVFLKTQLKASNPEWKRTGDALLPLFCGSILRFSEAQLLNKLFFYVQHCDLEKIKIIVSKLQAKEINGVNNNGERILEVAFLYIRADAERFNERLSIVEFLLENGVDVNQKTKSGHPILCHVISQIIDMQDINCIEERDNCFAFLRLLIKFGSTETLPHFNPYDFYQALSNQRYSQKPNVDMNEMMKSILNIKVPVKKKCKCIIL